MPNRRRWLLIVVVVVSSVVSLRVASGLPSRASAAVSRGENPLQTLSHSADDERVLTGRVVQRLVAGSYTYLGVQPADTRPLQWAVTLGRGQPLGSEVRVRTLGTKSDFYSRRLERSFAELRFGIVSRVDTTDRAEGETK
ncbi:MAG: hypothetical protein JWN04_197 [Myxococcaceae bacterium]|nr:hypothetical protein [Myxococcaceae bacterium]